MFYFYDSVFEPIFSVVFFTLALCDVIFIVDLYNLSDLFRPGSTKGK